MVTVLRAEGLTKTFVLKRNILGIPRQTHRAIEDVSFAVDEGRTLAIVGESGAGKSTLIRVVTRLARPDAGRIELLGRDVTNIRGSKLRAARKDIQIVFQDPFVSLDPRLTVGAAIEEGLVVHTKLSGTERRKRVVEVIERVGLRESQLQKRPSEFSGGQLQRVAIARAIVLRPKVLLCDEPTAALDVSIRAQVLNLLREIQRDQRIGILFVSHDLNVVREMSDELLVLKDGRIVETGPTDEVYAAPKSDYMRDLLAAIPALS
jgi:oligopeptide transport system ATP-binding protein